MEIEPNLQDSLINRVEKFKSQVGDLESIRSKLGFTKKEISDLLWVEPSAWTRWSKGISKPPEHIYRALGWYMELRDKNPIKEIQKRSTSSTPEVIPQIVPLDWAEERRELMQEIERKETLSFGWKLILVACLAISVFNLLFR